MADLGEGSRGPPRLFLDQTEKRRAEKNILRPPPYLRVWMTTPRLPSRPYLDVWIRHWNNYILFCFIKLKILERSYQ